MLNRSGANTDPCGAPAVIGLGEEEITIASYRNEQFDKDFPLVLAARVNIGDVFIVIVFKLFNHKKPQHVYRH